jgi:multiple sugar transport system permease protein
MQDTTTAAATTPVRSATRSEGRYVATRRVGVALHALALIIITLAALFPLYWMAAASLKTQNQIFAIPPVWWFHPTLLHYSRVLEGMNMMKALLNSGLVAGATTLVALAVGLPAGYAIGRFQFYGRQNLWFWFVTNFMVVPVVMVIPYFLLARTLHLINSHWLLVAIYQTFAVPLVVWLMADQFRSIPVELEEAALVDGANRLGAFFRVMLPLATPGVVVSSILAIIFSWNELLYSMLLVVTDERRR